MWEQMELKKAKSGEVGEGKEGGGKESDEAD